ELDATADEPGDEEVVHEGGVVRREDYRPGGNELRAERARAIGDERVQDSEHADDLIDLCLGLARADALVEGREVLGGPRVPVDLGLELDVGGHFVEPTRPSSRSRAPARGASRGAAAGDDRGPW